MELFFAVALAALFLVTMMLFHLPASVLLRRLRPTQKLVWDVRQDVLH